jgi:RND family efflux transporter MFP subunit
MEASLSAPVRARARTFIYVGLTAIGIGASASCGKTEKVEAREPGAAGLEISVGVVKIGRKPLARSLTLSSELVPFQEIDVFAKESGYIKDLPVDYGTHVQKGQLIATLEIPELQSQLREDEAAISNATEQITHAKNELSRVEAQHKVMQLQFDRLNGVAKSKPGMVAQQEVDASEGTALASAAQVEASRANLQSAQSALASAKAKREKDQDLFNYTKITAPFAGVITQRFANLGALVQAGTGSSTQAMPVVRLSEDDRFRLVIPVPETYVKYIHINDPVSVKVSSLDRTFPGKVARFSVDVRADTRTMHTEVDVLNPQGVLLPGLYADATIQLEHKQDAVAVPLQAVDRKGEGVTVDVIDASNKVEIRQIVIGIQTATDAEVLSGLKEGDLVVVSDRSSLKAGQTVQPKPVELMQYRSPEEQH